MYCLMTYFSKYYRDFTYVACMDSVHMKTKSLVVRYPGAYIARIG